MDLAAFRTALRKRLGGDADTTTWPDALVDESLRQGLDTFAAQGPVYESSFTVTTTGYAQDISGVAQLYGLLAVAWPWADGEDFAGIAVSWRYTDDAGNILLNVQAQEDDVLRLRYRKRHLIEDLDSAVATTLSADTVQIILWLAAGHACDLRALALAEDPAAAKDAIATLGQKSQRYMKLAESLLLRTAEGGLVSWREIGL